MIDVAVVKLSFFLQCGGIGVFLCVYVLVGVRRGGFFLVQVPFSLELLV